jgi:bifunctional UDP-N-acetylglucosamine pyrophosphorylase/glucosamine-1-phosphate N-acetyltransferase
MGALPTTQTLAVVLAAGEGTRMRSSLPKVLHAVAGQPMLGHVLAAVQQARCDDVALVIGPGRDDVAHVARSLVPAIDVVVQHERRGTAHATLHARAALARGYDRVVVLFADTPLVRPETIQALLARVGDETAVAVLGFVARDPTGYGRLLMDGDRLVAIREHKDASEAERGVTLCNAGLMALNGATALAVLEGIGNDNAQNEFYLTDAVEIVQAKGLSAAVVLADEDEVCGVNDRVQLAAAERLLQRRLREAAMRAGVTMIDPDSIFLCADTQLGRDVILEPNVVFGPGVTVEDGAIIHAHSYLEACHVGKGVFVGPFARLRPGTRLGAGAKVGNFVEIKNAQVADGAKISHLSYIGDAQIGAGANIGAGTITCNYDGFFKYETRIGAGAFIGSNSALVAPVSIGDRAYVGSGSVITDDVPADALAVARGRQVVKGDWAKAFRDERLARKKG